MELKRCTATTWKINIFQVKKELVSIPCYINTIVPWKYIRGTIFCCCINRKQMMVGVREKLHESETRWASTFCFGNVFPEKSFLVDDLVCFTSLYLRDFVFLNAIRSDPRQSKTYSGKALSIQYTEAQLASLSFNLSWALTEWLAIFARCKQ